MSTVVPSNNPTKKPTVSPTKEPVTEKIKKLKNVDNKTKNDLLKHKKKGNNFLFLTTLIKTHKNLYKLILCCIILIVLFYKLR
jgi:hypothetical protein